MDHRERAESIVSWSGLHLKYNAIFFYAGAGESASCQFLQPYQRGVQHFSLPEYSENSGKCISITLSTHVETVVLLSQLRQKPDDYIDVDIDVAELEGTSAETKATYEKIKKYVAEHNDGMKVSNLYIAQVKRKCGIELAENFNLPKSEDARQPRCPKEKEEAIVEALKAFQMI